MTATEAFIANYGLLAVFAGGLLEGETVLILAAVAVHHGILSLPSVFLVAALAAAIGDQIWFLLGRFGSDREFVKRFVAKPAAQRALARIDRHPNIFILSFRFIYGLRIAGAVACGVSKIPVPAFMALNFLASMLWTAVILALGYTFGTAIEVFLGEAKQIEWKLGLALVAFLAVFAVFRILSKHLRE